MMIFADGKDANDILSWWMFRFLMFTSKLIQLIMCFYMGFYVCHMNLRLQLVSWRYLEGEPMLQVLLFSKYSFSASCAVHTCACNSCCGSIRNL